MHDDGLRWHLMLLMLRVGMQCAVMQLPAAEVTVDCSVQLPVCKNVRFTESAITSGKDQLT